ncbi:MAG: YaaR family protein [Spirochaetota bacterium]|nr:YaaR family protein [Spirochaetota bacterium]
MIKIERRLKSDNPAFFNQATTRVGSGDPSLKQSSFSQEIQSQISGKVQKEITELISELDKSGKLFGENPSAENLHIYKRDVQSFLHFINKQSFLIKEVYGRRIDYKIVHTVNKKLEELSAEVLQRENGRMDLLAKIDEIRGMLIDLIL